MNPNTIRDIAIGAAVLAVVALVFGLIGTCAGPDADDLQAIANADSTARAAIAAELRGEFESELNAHKRASNKALADSLASLRKELAPPAAPPDTLEIEAPEVEESDEPAPKSEESKWWNPKKKN